MAGSNAYYGQAIGVSGKTIYAARNGDEIAKQILDEQIARQKAQQEARVKAQQAMAAQKAAQGAKPGQMDFATYQKLLNEARTSAGTRVGVGTNPVYDQNSTNEQLRKGLMDKVMNRGKFSYNINEDGLYNIYKDKYINQGRMAMRDTMGQAAALTGGYGNSYGQAVGQQAYDRALQSLNDVVPQLYGQALNMYEMEGNNLAKQYAMANDLVGEDWTKYRAAVSDYQANRALAEEQAQSEAKAAYQLDMDVYNRQQTAYKQQQDAYQRLVTLIGSTGYTPTKSELAEAQMTPEAADALRNEFLRQTGQLEVAGGGGGGGGYYGGGSKPKKTEDKGSNAQTASLYGVNNASAAQKSYANMVANAKTIVSPAPSGGKTTQVYHTANFK